METVTITIKFTTLQLIGAALQEIPYKLAAPALQEIEAAVQRSKELADEALGNKIAEAN